MKTINDAYLKTLHRSKSASRRMLALLLVLSLFVTSGVAWALRGVGTTLVNDAECGLEEHEHSEDCFEKQLICELEEGEEHQHSDACYADVPVCGMEEHIHAADCYQDPDSEMQPDDEIVTLEEDISDSEYDEVVYDMPADGNQEPESTDADTDAEAEADAEETFEASENDYLGMMKAGKIQIMAEGDEPGTIQTIDNIAEGIKFTLFDYGDAALDDGSNHYGWRWVEEADGVPGHWTHPNVKTSGINSGRNPDDDIMFFAYGTPVDINVKNPDAYNERDDSGKTTKYVPDKNSYAGDYNATPPYSGNRAVQKIVQAQLGADGYPIINSGANHSLAYLFDDNSSDYKTVYKGFDNDGVNYLLRKETSVNGVDHLIYNSDQNYAYFNPETQEFEVYDRTFRIVSEAHHKTTDINPKTGEAYGGETDVNPNFMIGFFPFNEYDETRRDPNFDVKNDDYKYNHHFGMKMEASFMNNKFDRTNVKEPIIFKYSGDDDMWVFVDGKLVLDLGGIHEPAGGMIDFSHGLVWMQDNGATGEGKPLDEVHAQLTTKGTPLYDYVSEHAPELIEGYESKTADQAWAELPKPIILNTSEDSQDRWIVKPITDYISDWFGPNCNKEHDIKMFYLERGGCYSNLAMEMNLPTVKPLSVFKNVDYKDHLDKAYDNVDYWFQVYEWDSNHDNGADQPKGAWVIPQDTNPEAPCYLPGSRFKLKDGARMKFDNLGQDRKFKVVEIGYSYSPDATGPEYTITSESFDSVTATDRNGTQVPMDWANGQAATNYPELDQASLKENNSYTFKNSLQQDFTEVVTKKVWQPPLANGDPLWNYDIKFKIMRTDSVTGEVKQVALRTNGIKKRTFVMTAQQWETGYTVDHLLKQYGNHFYSYRIEELNSPKGYKASYSTDQTGAAVITNIDMKEMEINVEKQWENAPVDKPTVQLKLTREKVGYDDSEPTALTINVVDEGNNLLVTKTINANDTDKIYAGGSAEISFDYPEGVVVLNADQLDARPADLSTKYDEDFIVLNDLKPITASDPIPNEVTVKVDTSKAEDSLLLLHHSFTGNTNGWIANSGDHNVSSVATDSAHAKGYALEISGRDRAWHGARLNLDPAIFKPGHNYTFSTYVYYDQGPDSIPFKFTFNDGLNKDNNGSFKQISIQNVPKGNWVQLTGTISLPAEIDPYAMYLIVETADSNNQPQATTFLMDEFIAVEGNKNVSVDNNGKVHVAIPADRTYLIDDHFTNDACGWSPHGNGSRVAHNGGNYGGCIRVTNRGDSWHGAEKSIASLGFVGGETYNLQTYITPADLNMKVTMYDGTYYRTVATFRSTGGSYQTTFKAPTDIDLSNSIIYIETADGKDNFDVYDFSIWKEGAPDTSKKNGYEYNSSAGEYVTNYDNYTLTLDKNSVTNPLKLNGTYEPDTEFEKTITLPVNDNVWTYHWDNKPGTDDAHKIVEDAEHFLYRYHLEEEWIDKEGNPIGPVNGNLMSADGDYLVTYSNNDVTTNDPDNPIIVKNRYIWYKLPATGGLGVNALCTAGVVLILIGLTGGCAVKKRERRYK